MNGASGNKPNYQLKHKLVGHDLGAVSVKFSPGGAWLASASADSTIKIWDPQSGKLIRTLTGHDKVKLSACQKPTAACQGTHQWRELERPIVSAPHNACLAAMRAMHFMSHMQLFTIIRVESVCPLSTHVMNPLHAMQHIMHFLHKQCRHNKTVYTVGLFRCGLGAKG